MIFFRLCIAGFIVFHLTASVAAQNLSDSSARSQYARGDYPGSLESYFSLAEKDARFYREIAALYREIGDYQNAAFYAVRYTEKHHDREGKLLCAQALYLDGKSQEALSLIAPFLQERCEFLAFFYAGLAHEDLLEYDAALENYRRALQFQISPMLSYRIAKIYYKKRDYQKAIDYFSRVLDCDASVRLAYYYLGSAYLRIGDFINAYRNLSKAASFYPASKVIAGELAAARRKLGQEYFDNQRLKRLAKRKAVAGTPYISPGGDIPSLEIGILRNVREFSFKSTGDIVLGGAKHAVLGSDGLYTIKLIKGELVLLDYESGKKIMSLSYPVSLMSGNNPFYIFEASYGDTHFWQDSSDTSFRGQLKIHPLGDGFTVVNIVSVEEYLYGVLPSEIYPTAGAEALKAQAVAARTLALKNRGRHRHEGFDFCSDVHCQVYRGISQERPATTKAVQETRGEVMVDARGLIEAFYHANCGGCLRSDIFGNKEYLRNRLDDHRAAKQPRFSPWEAYQWFTSSASCFCAHTERESNFRWQRVYDSDDFKLVFGWPLDELEEISIIAKGECEHIDSVRIKHAGRTETVKGDVAVRQLFDNLRSSAFKLNVKYCFRDGKRAPCQIIIWGAGFGHGTGMCQEGASRMAEENYDYKEILHHYYKDIQIQRVYE